MNLLAITSSPFPLESPAATVPFGAAPVDFTGGFLKMIFAMLFVIALAVVLIRYVVPRLAMVRKGGTGSDMKLVERLPLDAKKSLYIVEVEGKRLLIGASENHLALISDLEKSDAPSIPKKTS